MQKIVGETAKIWGCSGRVRVLCDGECISGADLATLRALGIAPGTEMTEEIFNKLQEMEFLSARQRIVRLLEGGDRSVRRIEELLLAKGYDRYIVERVILWLLERGLVNDAALADRLVERGNGAKGKRALAQDLIRKGIPQQVAQQAVERITPEDEEKSIQALLPRLLRRYGERDPRDARRLIAQALYRRGFSGTAIQAALDRALAGDTDWD